MAFPQRQAAIVGVYTTKQGRKLAQSSFELEMEAIKGAIADAGLQLSDIDGVIPMNATPHVGRASAHMFWAEQLGERPLTLLEIGLTSGAVAKAAVAIAAGMAEVVVLFWGKSGWELGPAGTKVPDRAPRTDPWGFEIFGGGYAHMYALWAQRYMHEFGITNEQLAQVAVTHRYHATLNPDSVMGERGEITLDDVVGSRMVASPLHLLDCALDTDGGYAIVIASKAVAEGTRKQPVWILGGAEAAYTDFYMTIDDPWFKEEGQAVRKTGDLAFAMAGVTRDDIDTAGLYDCFTITVLRDLEELGFCKLGEGADYFAEGHTRIGGKMPCNTDGGLLSNSHCGHPAGLHTIEVVRQLRGEAGERQIPDPKIGLSLAQGVSVHGQAGTLIMAVD